VKPKGWPEGRGPRAALLTKIALRSFFSLLLIKNRQYIITMNKVTLHYGSVSHVSASDVGQENDSGNGYYSYSYYLLPYSGEMTNDALAAVSSKLHKRHYSPPFTSLHCARIFGAPSKTGGVLLVGQTYHHGD